MDADEYPATSLSLRAAAVAEAFLGSIAMKEFNTADGSLFRFDYALSPAVDLVKRDGISGMKFLVPAKGSLTIEPRPGKKIVLTEGKLLLFNSDQYTISLPEQCQAAYWLFGIEPLLVRMGWTAIPAGRYTVSAPMRLYLTQMKEPPQRLAAADFWLSLQLTNLLFQLKEQIALEANPVPMKSYLLDYVLAADEFLQRNLSADVSIAQVARQVALNQTSLKKAFRAQYGMGIYGRLNFLRVQYAMQLLLQTDRTIQDIARECGYTTGANLRYNFLDVTKLTPQEWRQKYKL
jgi:AraC-like DNA-binding protein